MADTVEEKISNAFMLANLAAGFEKRLDTNSKSVLAESRNLSVEELAGYARQAVDNYMSACSEFMAVLPSFSLKGKSKASAVLSENVSYIMNRVAGLNSLIEELVILNVGNDVDSDSDSEGEGEEVTPADMKNTADDDGKSKMERRRANIVKEVRDTEQQYLTNLRTLKNLYIARMVEDRNEILSVEDAKIIFGNIDEIIGLSETFFGAISNRVSNWTTEKCIADIFNEYAMFFKVYVLYTNGFEYGNKKITEILDTNKDAKMVVENAQRSGVQNIQSLMINPIQRIPRYVLFLKDLKKCTPVDHPDFKQVELALSSFQEVADHVNERLRKHENNSKVLEIQSKLWKVRGSPCLLSPGRVYVMDGNMYKIRSSGILTEIHAFLFNDILVYATKHYLLPGKYHYRNQFEFYGAKASDVEARSETALIQGHQSAFTITSSIGKRTFVCDTINQRDVWVRTISKLIADKKSKRRSMQIHRSSSGGDDSESKRRSVKF